MFHSFSTMQIAFIPQTFPWSLCCARLHLRPPVILSTSSLASPTFSPLRVSQTPPTEHSLLLPMFTD